MSDNPQTTGDAHDKPDEQNPQGTPDSASESDTASDATHAGPKTTDAQGMPVDNPSGG